ncbi:glycosyltransferase [Candidatus Bathyarchaeota archaeon]|nr:glycosyltransferase [Candidatus Bathyarchaeota archaeon]
MKRPINVEIGIIAWKKLSRRSQLLSKAVNAKLWFFPDKVPYIRAFLDTLRVVVRENPRIIIVQLPQGPLLFEALLLKMLKKCEVVADVHTGFLVSTGWKGLLLNFLFVKFLRYADLILVHNSFQLHLIPCSLRIKTLVVFDPWYLISDEENRIDKQGDYIVFPSSFAPDEPLEEVLKSIEFFDIPVKMYITGDWSKKPEIIKHASDKVIFTGYLTNEEYYKLLSNAAAVLTGTKREYTSLMSAWEAVAYAKPLALTETGTLKSLFSGYAVFYDWKDSKSIANAIKSVLSLKPNMLIREELKLRTLESIKMLNQRLKRLRTRFI